jgi:hypothetical protein
MFIARFAFFVNHRTADFTENNDYAALCEISKIRYRHRINSTAAWATIPVYGIPISKPSVSTGGSLRPLGGLYFINHRTLISLNSA